MSSPSPIARSLATSRAVPTVYVEAKKKRNLFDDDDGDDGDQLVPDITAKKKEEPKAEDKKRKKAAEKPSPVLNKRPKKRITRSFRRDRDDLDEMVA